MSEPESQDPPATASFDIPGDPSEPVPENGVPRPPLERREKHQPGYTRARARDANGRPTEPAAPVRAHEPPRDFDGSKEKSPWPGHYGALWLTIEDWLPTQKIGDRQATPEDVMIGVQRVTGGGQGGGVMFPDPIDGGAVASDDSETGDVKLGRVLTNSYHMPLSDRNSRATFRLKFYWARGGRGDIKWSEAHTLPSPVEIARQRAAAGHGSGGYEAEPIPVATTMTMADGRPVPPGTDPEILIELGGLRADKARADSRGGGAAPVRQTSVDWEERLRLERELAEAKARAQAEADARAQAEKHAAEKAELRREVDELKAAQERAAQDARIRALEERIANPPQPEVPFAQQMVQLLQTLGVIQVGPDGKPVPVGAGQPYTGPQVTPEQQIAAAAKVLADAEIAKQKARAEVARTFGLTEPSSEIVHEEQEEPKAEPGFMEKHVLPMVKGLVAHPEGLLAAVGHIAEGSQLGTIASTVAKSVAVGRAAVAESKTRVPPAHGGGGGGFQPPSA